MFGNESVRVFHIIGLYHISSRATYELLTADQARRYPRDAYQNGQSFSEEDWVNMELIEREIVEKQDLPGRLLQQVVGKNAHSESKKMSMGFVHYSAASGPMQPHQHAEEVVYVINSDRAWVRHGVDKENLSDPVPLKSGMTMHFPELEWHVFQYEEGGHLDAIFFYGQVEGIRPEEIKSRS
jgi:hypothetical protein